jgi:hypothetical protein
VSQRSPVQSEEGGRVVGRLYYVRPIHLTRSKKTKNKKRTFHGARFPREPHEPAVFGLGELQDIPRVAPYSGVRIRPARKRVGAPVRDAVVHQGWQVWKVEHSFQHRQRFAEHGFGGVRFDCKTKVVNVLYGQTELGSGRENARFCTNLFRVSNQETPRRTAARRGQSTRLVFHTAPGSGTGTAGPCTAGTGGFSAKKASRNASLLCSPCPCRCTLWLSFFPSSTRG